jgi:predicted RNA binding protein YcfA (HicA-like mRNA interferase family)
LPKVPRISGAEAVRAFEKAGWVVSQQPASHAVLLKEGSILSLSIPLHRDQIRKSGLSVDEFIAFL